VKSGVISSSAEQSSARGPPFRVLFYKPLGEKFLLANPERGKIRVWTNSLYKVNKDT
jgi:hypothetical protein